MLRRDRSVKNLQNFSNDCSGHFCPSTKTLWRPSGHFLPTPGSSIPCKRQAVHLARGPLEALHDARLRGVQQLLIDLFVFAGTALPKSTHTLGNLSPPSLNAAAVSPRNADIPRERKRGRSAHPSQQKIEVGSHMTSLSCFERAPRSGGCHRGGRSLPEPPDRKTKSTWVRYPVTAFNQLGFLKEQTKSIRLRS